jgi:transposase
VTRPLDSVPDNLDALKAAFAAERMAREMAEARASGAEAMVVHLKLIIAKSLLTACPSRDPRTVIA